jgi:hypothetical protein
LPYDSDRCNDLLDQLILVIFPIITGVIRIFLHSVNQKLIAYKGFRKLF